MTEFLIDYGRHSSVRMSHTLSGHSGSWLPCVLIGVVFRRRPHHLTGCNAWCAYGS
ncbi:hypothetical protein OF001_U300032 [Pseudomonas sp. OF001]|nr:hypothetical protein OF001_U300032 [Pseudomonas sp. OF001]